MAVAEGEAALDSGAVFPLLDPREFGDFYNDLETSRGTLQPASTPVAAVTFH